MRDFYILHDSEGTILGISIEMPISVEGTTVLVMESEKIPDDHLKMVVNGELVDSPTLIEATIIQDRRSERMGMFSQTLDVLNPVWYDTLTEAEKLSIPIWRQAWLDYPETGVKPDDLDIF